MIILKHVDTLAYLMSPKLRKILSLIEHNVGNVTLTSMFRPDERGIHGQFPLRAVDIRCRDEDIGHAIAALVNNVWLYDPSRPNMMCALAHGKKENFHIHLQVHDRTEEISD